MLIQYRIQCMGDSVNISQFVDPDGMLGDATSPGNAVAANRYYALANTLRGARVAEAEGAKAAK